MFREAEDKRCVLVVNDVALAEAVRVLTSFYKRERAGRCIKSHVNPGAIPGG